MRATDKPGITFMFVLPLTGELLPSPSRRLGTAGSQDNDNEDTRNKVEHLLFHYIVPSIYSIM